MSSSRVLPAQRVLPAARVVSASRVLSRRPVLGVYTTAEAGETLIPHLYDWLFDGISSRVLVSLQPTISARGTYSFAVGYIPILISSPPSRGVIGFREAGAELWQFVYHAHNNIYFVRESGGSTVSYFLGASPSAYTLFEIAYVLTQQNVLSYRDGILLRTYTRILESDDTFVGVNIGAESSGGAGPYSGYISYVMVYASEVNVQNIYNRIVDVSGLRLLLDPTFFDGSKYLDLSGNNNHGIPYGGVSRVPAHRTWMYRVRGLYQGDRVRVLIPPMCRYRVGTGEWQVNDTWSTLELFLDPGWVSLVFEGL